LTPFRTSGSGRFPPIQIAAVKYLLDVKLTPAVSPIWGHFFLIKVAGAATAVSKEDGADKRFVLAISQ
jgi:hypothetical protein